MKAIVLKNQSTDITNSIITEIALPKLQHANDVLIKVRYASINPVDYKLAANHPKIWHYPYIIGLDLSGEVVQTGSACSKLKVGDIVAIHGNLTYGGALAEYVVHPEHAIYKIPDNIPLDLAAATPCAGLTAYLALVRKMNIQTGKTIFIQGGSGGVGSFAILIAKYYGLKVITTCSTKNSEYVQSLGADLVINYKQEDPYLIIQQIFPDGIDYILETSNKANLQRDLSILAFNGHIASIVGIIATADIPEFTSGFSFHEIALGGAYLSGHYVSQCDLSIMGTELLTLVAKIMKSPQIISYAFEEYKQAFADLQANAVSGKIVIKI